LYSITRDFPLMTSKPMKGSAQEVLGVTKGGWGGGNAFPPAPRSWGVEVCDPLRGHGGIRNEDKLRRG